MNFKSFVLEVFSETYLKYSFWKYFLKTIFLVF